ATPPHQRHFQTTSYQALLPETLSPPALGAIKFADSVKSADQVLLYKYSPPSVVIDHNLDILQFRGKTVPFLEPAPGFASYNLLKMAHLELVTSLRLCLQVAKKQESPARKENVTFE